MISNVSIGRKYQTLIKILLKATIKNRQYSYLYWWSKLSRILQWYNIKNSASIFVIFFYQHLFLLFFSLSLSHSLSLIWPHYRINNHHKTDKAQICLFLCVYMYSVTEAWCRHRDKRKSVSLSIRQRRVVPFCIVFRLTPSSSSYLVVVVVFFVLFLHQILICLDLYSFSPLFILSSDCRYH